MPQRKFKLGTLYRAIPLDRAAIDEESRTVQVAFSSEEPVERFFGTEILDHTPSSVRLDRLRTGGPVLVGHEPEPQVGVVEQVSIDRDRRGRAVLRIGRSAKAEEVWQDILDGIRTNVSVGYRIHELQLEKSGDQGDVYRVTDWEPLEISFVSVPADSTVGVGRDMSDPEYEITIDLPEEERVMPDKITPAASEPHKQPPQPAIDINAEREAAREEARRAEQERVRTILGIAEKFDALELGREFVNSGKGVDEFQAALLERLGSGRHPSVPDPEVGLTEREARQFSFLRAINALANPQDRRAQEAAAFEFEVSQAAADKLRRDTRGITVPVDVLRQGISTRDLTVGTATAGGNLVATELLAESFIELLRNRMAITGRATVLDDLVGNIAIPRQTGGASAFWVAEGSAPTESQAAFDQVTLSPKTVAGFTDISRKLMIQSSVAAENFVRQDLARAIGLALDLAGVNGSGASNEPLGILNTTGIGSVVGGTNGAAPTWSHIVQLETAVATANADVGTLYYLTNAKVRGTLKETEKASGTAQFVWGEGNEVNGYEAIVSNQVPSNLTKGTGTNLSAIIFGNLADLIVAMWSGVDLVVNPYINSGTGTVRVEAYQDADIAVRHAESFAAMTDAITV